MGELDGGCINRVIHDVTVPDNDCVADCGEPAFYRKPVAEPVKTTPAARWCS
jgi:hypothetical protein